MTSSRRGRSSRLTIAHARQVPGLSRFLLGRFFYSDAVNTVIVVMSIVAVQAAGFTEQTTVLILLLPHHRRDPHVVRVGRLSDRVGPRHDARSPSSSAGPSA